MKTFPFGVETAILSHTDSSEGFQPQNGDKKGHYAQNGVSFLSPKVSWTALTVLSVLSEYLQIDVQIFDQHLSFKTAFGEITESRLTVMNPDETNPLRDQHEIKLRMKPDFDTLKSDLSIDPSLAKGYL